MLQRRTQTAAFWRDQFEATPEDLNFLYNYLFDAAAPRTLVDLAVALIEEYLRREQGKIEIELAKGSIYQPKERYRVGQRLVFPTLDFATGDVIGVRTGQNPEHGVFDVVKVQFTDGRGAREYAAGLQTHHRLNDSNGAAVLDSENLLSTQEIYQLYKNEIDDGVLYALEEGASDHGFIEVQGKWLLKDMLADVHVGHFNIAEAMIEVAGQPLSTEQLLAEMDLDGNISKSMRALSLDHGLANDPRFDVVRSGSRSLWFLSRLEPDVAVETPWLLRYTPQRYNRSLLSVELLQFEWELDDEWGESTLSSEMPSLVPSTSILLIYPHRRYGTLPLNGRTRPFFPGGTSGKAMVSLIDGRWGTRYTGWVCFEGRYVAGLSKWMEDHAIPSGAYITLDRGSRPTEVIVDFRTRRAKREWARIATPDLQHLRLNFELNKIPVACEYDEQLIVAETDPAALDAFRTEIGVRQISLYDIVEQIAQPPGDGACQNHLQRSQHGAAITAWLSFQCPDRQSQVPRCRQRLFCPCLTIIERKPNHEHTCQQAADPLSPHIGHQVSH